MRDEPVFLYVEDDPLSQEIMSMMMTLMMNVQHLTIFDDSSNFLQRLKALQPQPTVIILDIHVKPHDGFEMLHLVRAEPQYEAVTVIALTASVMNEEVNQLKTSGFDGAIGKPLSLELFPKLINRIIQGETVWHIA